MVAAAAHQVAVECRTANRQHAGDRQLRRRCPEERHPSEIWPERHARRPAPRGRGLCAPHRSRESLLSEIFAALIALFSVMPGLSRSKNGVLSHAYVPGIHVLTLCTAKNVDARDKRGHDA